MLQKENNREIKYKDTEVGRIPEHWDVVRLGDVCEINKKNYKNDKEWIDYLDTGNLTENRIAGLQKLFSNIDKIPSRAKRLVECKDILISLVRPNQKHFGVLEREIENLIVSTGFAVITVKEADVYYKYLYYYLTNEETTNHLQNLAESSVSTYPTLKPSDIEKLLIPLPPIEEQQKIAKTLSDIDNKIETNNKISQTLETMAQTLFNEWFVEFNFPDANGNPYKKSGGKMVESELGEIPEGWEVSSLSKVANYLNGLAMQKYRPKDDEESYPVLKIKELNQGNTTANSDRCAIDIPDKYVVNQGDIIFSWSGTLLVDIWSGETAGLNQHLFKVTSEKFPKWYYYLWTKYHLEKFIGIAKNKATTMGHINRGELDNSFVLVPVENQILMFSKVLSSKIDELIIVKKQNVHLKRIQKHLVEIFFK